MNFYADSALDLDDGDIEIDIDSAPTAQHVAIPDNEDEFMIDYEDHTGDQQPEVSSHKPAPIITKPAVEEDDLIDYSDEDFQPFPQKPITPTTPTVKPYFMSAADKKARDEAARLQPQVLTSGFGFGFAGIARSTPPQTTGFSLPPMGRSVEHVEQAPQKDANELTNEEPHHQEGDQEAAIDFTNTEDYDYVRENSEQAATGIQGEDVDDGASIQAPEHQANTNAPQDEEDESPYVTQDGEVQEQQFAMQNDEAQEQQPLGQEDEIQEQQSAEDDDVQEPHFAGHTITVNFNGNELWLFKEYDEDNSGDWLLEDMSILDESIKDLFDAIRASLGQDILPGTELGFRLDHLHNMEIYEDSTVCVAVSLERVVNLYHTLLNQDGVTDHESFYIYLLSRPRFATLLNDVMKFAEHGAGYSGFNTAVAAGETQFLHALSGHATEHESTEWEIEEDYEGDDQHQDLEQEGEVGVEEEHTEYADQLHGDALAGVAESDEDYSGQEQHGHVYGGNGGQQDQNDERPDPANSASADGAAHPEQTLTHGSTQVTSEQVQTSASSGQPSEDKTKSVTPGSITSPTAQSKREEEEIDYSDEEQDDPPKPDNFNSVSTSSTIQGDASAGDRDPTKLEGEQYASQDDISHEADNADDGQSHVEEQLGHGEDTELYQDYAQTYGHDDLVDDYTFGIDETWANEDLNEYPNQALDEQLQNDFVHQGGLDGTNAVDGFIGEDNFLDLDSLDNPDYPAVWPPGQGTASNLPEDDLFPEEEEDGAVEHPEAAASSTADPVATSSLDLQNTSPSGQKRSIDEVGDSAGDALDHTGTPLGPISRMRFQADFEPPDLKRPRV